MRTSSRRAGRRVRAHVISPDPPGHGRSPALQPTRSGRRRWPSVAADLLSELGIDRAVFVGFSWGGRVGCWFAARLSGADGAWRSSTAVMSIQGCQAPTSPPTGHLRRRGPRESEDGLVRELGRVFRVRARVAETLDSGPRRPIGRSMAEAQGPRRADPQRRSPRRDQIRRPPLSPSADTYPLVAAAGVPGAAADGCGARVHRSRRALSGRATRGSSRMGPGRYPRSRLVRADAGGRPHRRVVRRPCGRSAAAVDRDRQVEHDSSSPPGSSASSRSSTSAAPGAAASSRCSTSSSRLEPDELLLERPREAPAAEIPAVELLQEARSRGARPARARSRG